jgi:hypothetical protein
LNPNDFFGSTTAAQDRETAEAANRCALQWRSLVREPNSTERWAAVDMAARDGICRFCTKRGPLVKAHIIPEAFFRAIGGGKDAPILVSNNLDMPFPKRIPIGVYDSELLCDLCERKFDRVDAYGTRTLLHTLRGSALSPMRHGSQVIGFEVSGIDQALLLRFFIATLWRASVTKNPVFARVALGARYEELAKGAVTSDSLAPDFGAVLAVFKSPQGADQSIGLMDPIRQRYEGVNIYRFYFGPYHAHIKVDQRPFIGSLQIAALGSNPLLRIIRRDFQRSKDFKSMRHAAAEQHQNSILARRQRGQTSIE